MNDLIARVKELDGKASKNLCKDRVDSFSFVYWTVDGFISEIECIKKEDADMILEYRTACPQLADRCEKLEKALEVAKTAMQSVIDGAFDPELAKYVSMTPLAPIRIALSEINKLTT